MYIYMAFDSEGIKKETDVKVIYTPQLSGIAFASHDEGPEIEKGKSFRDPLAHNIVGTIGVACFFHEVQPRLLNIG